MRTAALLATALLALGACGSEDEGEPTAAGTTQRTTTGPAAPPGESPSEEPGTESRPSAQDRSIQSALTGHLRQEGATRSRGEWSFADIEDVRVRMRQVAIATDLGPKEREDAASICLAARRYFLDPARMQTAADVIITGRRRVVLVRC